MFVRQSKRLARCIHIFRARLSVRLKCPCYFWDAFADQRVRDDELRFPIVAPFRHVQCVEKFLHILAFDLLNIKAVCLHTFAGVFALRLFRCGIQRDGVRIVDVDQVIEAPVASESTRFGGDAFLHVAIPA